MACQITSVIAQAVGNEPAACFISEQDAAVSREVNGLGRVDAARTIPYMLPARIVSANESRSSTASRCATASPGIDCGNRGIIAYRERRIGVDRILAAT
jgi:hypothetical protein